MSLPLPYSAPASLPKRSLWHRRGIRCSSNSLEDYTHRQDPSQCRICHPRLQSDTYGLKALPLTLRMTVRRSRWLAGLLNVPLQKFMPILRQLPCLDLTAAVNTSNEYQALTLKCVSLTSLAATALTAPTKGRNLQKHPGLLWTLISASSTLQLKCPELGSRGNLTH